MKYHALFVIFESIKILNCRLLQIIGGALWVKGFLCGGVEGLGHVKFRIFLQNFRSLSDPNNLVICISIGCHEVSLKSKTSNGDQLETL